MRAKDYLMQACYLNQRIRSKMNQLQELNDLAVGMTQVMSDMPKDPSGSQSRMEDTVVKIVDFQNDVTADLDELVSLQKEISGKIGRLGKSEYQVILMERYLENRNWHEIAEDMHYSVRWVQSLHGEALAALQNLLDEAG